MHRQLNLFYFFIYCCQHHERKTPVLKYFCYQTDSDQVLNTIIFSAVFLASPYYNYLSSTASTTMICWRCHSNSVNTGSSLPKISDVMTRKRRNVIGIDMIRSNRIARSIILYWWFHLASCFCRFICVNTMLCLSVLYILRFLTNGFTRISDILCLLQLYTLTDWWFRLCKHHVGFVAIVHSMISDWWLGLIHFFQYMNKTFITFYIPN
jgi:hypothetical protein